MKKVLAKISRRAQRLLRKTIPYNYQFKPIGYYATSKAYAESSPSADTRYSEIYPDYEFALKIPVGMKDALSKYAIYDTLTFTPEPTMVSRITHFVVAIPNGRLFANGTDTLSIISPDNKLVGDVSYQHHPARITSPAENGIFSEQFFTKPTKLQGVVFSMLSGGGAAINYGHWLIDTIPRIHLLKQSGWFDQVHWFLLPKLNYDFQKDSLTMLGIAPEQIVECEDYVHLEADVLMVTSHPRGQRSYIVADWILNFIRQSYLREELLQKSFPARVYISRRDGNTRRVTNENELIQLLEEHGFKIYELSSLSFRDKIGLFHSATCIVAVTSAGLANFAFCKPGTKVVEIFSQGLVHVLWYNIAIQAGLDYHFQIFKNQTVAKDIYEGNNEDITVDLGQMEKLLLKLIN